jgi:hypothetical protein
VATWPEPAAIPASFAAAATALGDWGMRAGTRFHRIEGDLEMQSLGSESQGVMGNLASATAFRFRQAGNSAQLIGFLNAFRNRNLALVMVDADGQQRILGSRRLPAKIIDFTVQTGEKAGDDKFVAFTVHHVGHVPYVWAGAVPLEPAGNLRATDTGALRTTQSGSYRIWQ